MATQNLGRVGLVLKGEWDSATAYTALDVVSHDGNAWAAKQNSTNVEPTTGNSDFWQLFSNNADLVATVQGYKEDAASSATAAAASAADAEASAQYGEDAFNAIAHTFDPGVDYTAGKYVWYNGELYRFSIAHPAGAWIGTDAARYTATDELPLIQQALGAKADAADVADLKSALSESIDVVSEDGKKYIPEDITWINGYVGKDDGLIRSSSLSITGIFQMKMGQTVTVGTRNKNICCIGTTTSNTIAVGNTVTVLVKTSSVDQYEEHSYTAPSDMNIVVSVLASEHEVKVTEETNLSEMFVDVANIQNAFSEMLIPSVNLADPSKFTRNRYMDASGNTGSSSSYFYTGKIAVSAGDVLYYNSSDKRYVTFFNGSTVVPWSDSTNSPLTIPSGITDVVVTGYMSKIDSFMVSKINVAYQPYGDTVKSEYLQIDNKNALNGNDGISIVADTLAEDTTLEITDYPKIIASHDRISGYCKFSAINEILFGYGYGANRYCGVTDTNINIYIDGELSTSTPHGITISDYLSFSIVMDDNRVGQITINSTGGTATATVSLSYNKNGLPFIRSSTALTSIKLSAICKDIKNPIWWFGDSYSSLAPERIIGQLNSYGIIGNMLIDAVPGGRSYSNATTGGYIEFLKLTKLAKPKYVIWALGMNDNDANYNLYLTLVKNYCDINGISLYAVKIPSVPNIDNTAKGTFIDTLGLPSIDWATAVNATAQGVWYNGYLSSDNVHPTVVGAQAMAARTMVDCPAIMQF